MNGTARRVAVFLTCVAIASAAAAQDTNRNQDTNTNVERGQAKTAAANICGKDTPHDKTPWFWSDQYELKLQIVGLSQHYDSIVLRGDPATRSFSCCYLRDGELIALDAVNHAKDFMAARKLIAERARPDPARLADDGVPLKETVS